VEDNLGDWRIDAVVTLASHLTSAYPGGPSFTPGDHAYICCGGQVNNRGIVNFIAPSPVALALNTSWNAALSAERLKEQIAWQSTPSPDGLVPSVTQEALTTLYDFFEQAMISVFFAYQSLEAFANDKIVGSGGGKIEIQRRDKNLSFDRREAERSLSTAEKLGDVVPKIIGIESPKGIAVWQRFRELEQARDEVVHLKNQTLVSSGTKNESRVLFQLLETDNRIWPQNALKLLLVYFVDGYSPRWAKALQSKIRI